MMAAAQSPAAVVRPLTRLSRVTMIVPAPMKPMPEMTCAPRRDVGKQMQGEQQVLACERGDGGAEADEDVRAEARGAALCLALGADHAAADDGQRQPDENGPEAQGADGVKTMQHGTASFLRSLR